MLKQLIEDFQKGKSEEVINKIMAYVEIDYLKDETRRGQKETVKIDLPDPLMYVAYRIRAFREKLAKGAKSLRAGNIDTWREVEEVIDKIECRDGYRFDSYVKLYDELDCYDDLFDTDDMDYLKYIVGIMADFEEEIDEKKNKIRNELEPYILKSLKYAISKVNPDKEDKEIIKYINKVWLSKFVELQVDGRGLKRIQRKENGINISFIVRPTFKDIELMIFSKSLKLIGGVDKLKTILNKNQIKFVDDVVSIVQEKIDNKNFSFFRFDNNGKTVLNKRMLAMELGINENNFKKKLKRIQDKATKLVNSEIDKICNR